MTTTATAQSFDPQERRKYLGASELAAILGVDKYKTAFDIYNEKTGRTEPFQGNAHTRRGNALEAIAAEFFTEQTGKPVRRRNEAFAHAEYPFIVGHIDRTITGEKHLLEIKCPSIAAFRKFQREGLPQSYIIQANAYMGLGGYPKLTFCIFCADAWDAAIFTLDFDADIYKAAIDAGVKFWNENVLTDTVPQDSTSQDEAWTSFVERGGSVTIRDDEHFIAKAATLREAIQLKADAEELFEVAKKDVLEAVEETCGIYECPGLRLHYTEQAGRVTIDKKAMAADGIDLTKYEKQGKPFKSFRPYLLNSQEG